MKFLNEILDHFLLNSRLPVLSTPMSLLQIILLPLKTINYVLSLFKFKVVRTSRLEEFRVFEIFYWNDPFLAMFNYSEKVKKLVKFSKSQIRQDLFVVSHLDFKKDGFFVEIGALNGVDGSNTYMLEKVFKWKGIVVEPSMSYRNEIANFRDCLIDYRCLWSRSNISMEFTDYGKTGLSTLSEYELMGRHIDGGLPAKSNKYMVNSVSLDELLKDHNAPRCIDYVSIDTEGSEFEILRVFDFSSWDIKIFTIEHNFDQIKRENIYALMRNNGYKRIHKQISYQDDWYTRN